MGGLHPTGDGGLLVVYVCADMGDRPNTHLHSAFDGNLICI